MSINCKLNNNITIGSGSGGGGNVNSNCGNVVMSAGGIRSRIYLYNIDDVDNLVFENDKRYETNLYVETIITDKDYYYVDGTKVIYSENESDDKYTHRITMTIANISTEIEKILNDSVNSRYLVAFRPNGDNYYRLFGWKYGAKLTYNLNISEDTAEYQIDIEYTGEYPLFSVYSDNFDLRNKIFSPIFKPNFNIPFCELSDGDRSGWVVASYVTKVNSAGLALDEDNRLVMYSGKKQEAYKFNTITNDLNYKIIGTYTDNAIYDGQPVKIYDPTICPPNATGTITITPNSFNFYSNNLTNNYNLISNNSWRLLTSPTLVSAVNSGNGNLNGVYTSNGNGGSEILIYQNRITYEQVQVSINSYFIKTSDNINLNYGTNNFQINPNVTGGNGNYTYSTSYAGATLTKNGNILNVNIPTVDDGLEFTITLTHASFSQEKKIINIKVGKSNISANWVLIEEFCEQI